MPTNCMPLLSVGKCKGFLTFTARPANPAAVRTHLPGRPFVHEEPGRSFKRHSKMLVEKKKLSENAVDRLIHLQRS